MQRRGQADRRDIGRPVHPGLHLVDRGVVEDPAQPGDAAGVRDRRPDVVDQLLLQQFPVVPDRVEHLADRERRRGVFADQPERGLVLGRGHVLQPEQVEGLERLAQLGRLDRGQPVVRVVQQRQLGPELVAHGLEHRRHVAQVGAGVPLLLDRPGGPAGRLMVVAARAAGAGVPAGGHAVHALEAGNAALDPDRAEPLGLMGAHGVEQLGQVPAGRVAVGQAADPAAPAEQLVQRQLATLALMSHSAVSTAAIAAIVIGPRRQYAPRYRYCQVSSIWCASRPMSSGTTWSDR